MAIWESPTNLIVVVRQNMDNMWKCGNAGSLKWERTWNMKDAIASTWEFANLGYVNL